MTVLEHKFKIMGNLNLSSFSHRFLSPLTKKLPIALKVLRMRLHVEFV